MESENFDPLFVPNSINASTNSPVITSAKYDHVGHSVCYSVRLPVSLQLHAKSYGWIYMNFFTKGRSTIRYDSVYLTCSKKLTGCQLSLPHGINEKLESETKAKLTRVIDPVQSHYHDCSPVQ